MNPMKKPASIQTISTLSHNRQAIRKGIFLARGFQAIDTETKQLLECFTILQKTGKFVTSLDVVVDSVLEVTKKKVVVHLEKICFPPMKISKRIETVS